VGGANNLKTLENARQYRYVLSALTRLSDLSTSARAALFRDPDRLRALSSGGIPGGIDGRTADALSRLDWNAYEAADRKAEASGARILGFGEEGYPEALTHLADPPPALYALGSPECLAVPCVALVGARQATVYGRNVAETLAADLARSGVTVVSGLARGIDAASHEGSLAVPGRAAAVLGTGIDRVYPAENGPLQRRMVEGGGLVLTEYPPGTAPRKWHFPQRNRIIAGLCWGVVVVEAEERSGSLITARMALESDREVLAVPHAVTSRAGIGPNALIHDGARLVRRAEDILELMPAHLKARLHISRAPGGIGAPPVSAEAAGLLERMPCDAAVGLDALAADASLEMPRLMALLLELQMAGLCVELPGMRYARRSLPKTS